MLTGSKVCMDMRLRDKSEGTNLSTVRGTAWAHLLKVQTLERASGL